MAEVAKRAACVIRTGTEVLNLETRSRQVTRVFTTRGDSHPKQVVVAAGSWSSQLGRMMSLRVPSEGGKGYSVTVQKPAIFPKIPLMLADAKVSGTPMGDHLRFSGTLELAGLDLSVNLPRTRAIPRAAQAYLAGLEKLNLVERLAPCRPGWPPHDRTVYCPKEPATGHKSHHNRHVIGTNHGETSLRIGCWGHSERGSRILTPRAL